MLSTQRLDFLLLILFFVFSLWLMNKSFGYDPITNTFRVARHQVGDFGLHLSLIRSFSWGNNFPPESPFYPGKPLPYHYYFDMAVGLLEKIGTRIDLALNGLSAIFFTLLLFFIYKLPQVIFRKNVALGLLSVVLFVFHSNFTFVDFVKSRGLSVSLFSDLWHLPNYLNIGPFDGSLISIFFTLNVFLNQRHLIAGLAISLGLLYFILNNVLKSKHTSLKLIILAGIVLGVTSRLHTLIFLGSSFVFFLLLVFFKRYRLIPPLFIPAIMLFSFHLEDIIIGQNLSHPLINPGFLAVRPLTFESFALFWFLNLGLAIFLIPLGLALSNNDQKKIFLSIFSLFIFGNLFQVSFRIEHNHSLLNYFLIMANFYIASVLIKVWEKKLLGRVAVIVAIFFLTVSGFIDLMAVKNDYQYVFSDAPANKFLEWISARTDKNDVFIARQELLDPITLSGRKNYLGHNYYTSVMGYDTSSRERLVRGAFEASSAAEINTVKKEGVKYIVIPLRNADFHYRVNQTFLTSHFQTVYKDTDVIVLKI